MFGLSQQIGSDPGRIGIKVGYHQRLCRSGQSIQADDPINLLLRECNEQATRPDDFIYFWNAFSTEGQCSDSLGPADLKHLFNAAQIGSRQDGGVGIGRRTNDNFGTPATCAGMTDINKDEGRGAVPPGT